MEISKILFELGENRDNHFGSVSFPIYQTSNFCFKSVGEMREKLVSELDNPFYTRGNNPTVGLLRKKLAALEGGEDSLVFGSGSAAISSAIISQVKAGDHVVCVKKPYSWTEKLLVNILADFGVTYTFIDGRLLQNWQEAIKPETRLFIMESPNSMTFELQDITEVCKLARSEKIITILDNSYASPLNQSPIKMGVDIVAHSASKYLSGHSDVVAGIVVSSKKIIKEIFEGPFMTLGGIISPHDASLIIRGLRTLPIRMDRVSKNTAEIVSFLEDHPLIEKVIYPHSPSHPQYNLAINQQKKGSGQFSILLKAKSIEEVELFVDALKTFLIACSWGGYESLIFPICALSNSANYGTSSLPWNFIRVYVGIEDPQYLISDLNQAFEKLKHAQSIN